MHPNADNIASRNVENLPWRQRKVRLSALARKSILSIKSKKTKRMSMNIKPLADRVLVEPAAAEEKTASGIIIPDTAKEKPQRGTVVAVGPGKPDEPTTVKVGDTVLYGKYSGTELQVEGSDFMIMRESDILAIV
jgi:chaperonin GroES